MQLVNILSQDCTRSAVQCSSKKRILELISEIAAPKLEINAQIIFESLLAREKMGSTGIGQGIAIPHGKISSQAKALGVLLTSEAPIEFDAIDKKPVDLFFALLVPEDQCQQHIATLSQVASRLDNKQICKELRQAKSDEILFSLMTQEIEPGS